MTINFGLPTQNLKEKEYNIGNNEFFLDILDIKFSLKNKNCLLLLSKGDIKQKKPQEHLTE